MLFSWKTKRLRRRKRELLLEIRTLQSEELQLIDRLHKVHQSKYELDADRDDHDGGD